MTRAGRRSHAKPPRRQDKAAKGRHCICFAPLRLCVSQGLSVLFSLTAAALREALSPSRTSRHPVQFSGAGLCLSSSQHLQNTVRWPSSTPLSPSLLRRLHSGVLLPRIRAVAQPQRGWITQPRVGAQRLPWDHVPRQSQPCKGWISLGDSTRDAAPELPHAKTPRRQVKAADKCPRICLAPLRLCVSQRLSVLFSGKGAPWRESLSPSRTSCHPVQSRGVIDSVQPMLSYV